MAYTMTMCLVGAQIFVWYDIFINCSWVDTQWQYTFTHKQYIETTQITTEQHKYKLMWKSVDRAPSLWVLPWHLPYNWGKGTENLSQGKKNLSQVKKNLNHSTVYILPKNTHTLQNPHTHKHTHYKTHSYTHTHTHPRIHTLQNSIKPPQYKLKRNAYRKSKIT